MRRSIAALAVLLAAVSLTTTPAAAHAGMATISMATIGFPDPGTALPVSEVTGAVEFFRSELERFSDALERGEFGEPLPGDASRFDDIAAQFDDIETSMTSKRRPIR